MHAYAGSDAAWIDRGQAIVVDFSEDPPRELGPDNEPLNFTVPYRPEVLRNGTSWTKHCGWIVDEHGKLQAEGGVELDGLIDLSGLLRGFLGKISATVRAKFESAWERSIKRSRSAELYEKVQYFWSDDIKSVGLIEIAQKKTCTKTVSGYTYPVASWFFVSAGDQIADLDNGLLRSNGLPVNRNTGTLGLHCAEEYFRVSDFSTSIGFPRESIPFVISRIAAMPRLGGNDACAIATR